MSCAYDKYRQGLSHYRTAMVRFAQGLDLLDPSYWDKCNEELGKGTADISEGKKKIDDLVGK